MSIEFNSFNLPIFTFHKGEFRRSLPFILAHLFVIIHGNESSMVKLSRSEHKKGIAYLSQQMKEFAKYLNLVIQVFTY